MSLVRSLYKKVNRQIQSYFCSTEQLEIQPCHLALNKILKYRSNKISVEPIKAENLKKRWNKRKPNKMEREKFE